jgi:hypothetical protein
MGCSDAIAYDTACMGCLILSSSDDMATVEAYSRSFCNDHESARAQELKSKGTEHNCGCDCCPLTVSRMSRSDTHSRLRDDAMEARCASLPCLSPQEVALSAEIMFPLCTPLQP